MPQYSYNFPHRIQARSASLIGCLVLTTTEHALTQLVTHRLTFVRPVTLAGKAYVALFWTLGLMLAYASAGKGAFSGAITCRWRKKLVTTCASTNHVNHKRHCAFHTKSAAVFCLLQ